jgi:dihydrolipoamide dehydrogenase
MSKRWDLAILGGGPGGYVAALRAAQLKRKVVLVENDRLGGTCINYGCIPTKHLLYQTSIYQEFRENKNFDGPVEEVKCNWRHMQDEKSKTVERLVKGIEFLLARNGVDVLRGTGFLKTEKQVVVDTEEGERILEAEKIILATGSNPGGLPFIDPNGIEVLTSRDALELDSVPRDMLIIGAGAVGLEIGMVYQRLGTDVTILEILPTILPGSDREIVTRLERLLKLQGLKIYTQMKIEQSEIEGSNVRLRGICFKDESPFAFKAEKVLIAAGRKPNSGDLREKVSLDKQGFVKVNAQLETGIPGIYAIGDLIGGKLLAHKASHEGIIAAENASGLKETMNYEALPMAVFTSPEFSSVGYTEEEARERGIKHHIGLFSLQANGRALTMGKGEGIVKVIVDDKDKIIGGHILAPNASEIITEITLAMNNGLKVQDVFASIHIHPTLSEAVMEASMKARNRALHTLNI